MSNRQNPHGLIPVYHLTGGEIRQESRIALKATNAAIYIGDPLMQVTGGFYDLWTAGNPLAGVAAQNYSASHYGGTVVGAIQAYFDPKIVYRAQVDSGSGSLTTQAGYTLNATITNAGTPGSNGLDSAATLNDAGATTSTYPLKVVGLYSAPYNTLGAFNELLVVPNDTPYGAGVAGV